MSLLPQQRLLQCALGIVMISAASADLAIHENDHTISVSRGETAVLTYHKAVMPAPEGAPDVFARSGFIHPLRTPSGAVVTSIHDEDHIHHMGLWHAWVKSFHRGRELDFWNLGKGDATVRFAGSSKVFERDESVGFTVAQEQVALAKDEHAEEVVLAEKLTVTVHESADANVIDYVIEQTNVTDAPLELPAYRYGGGIAFRALSSWGKPNDSYVTSTGLDRTKGHATRADWTAMHGPTENGEATVVIMSHPSNHDSPQRVRIWPEGHVFFNYVPAQEHDWMIGPGETITLRYRVIVVDGRPSMDAIAQWWEQL